MQPASWIPFSLLPDYPRATCPACPPVTSPELSLLDAPPPGHCQPLPAPPGAPAMVEGLVHMAVFGGLGLPQGLLGNLYR